MSKNRKGGIYVIRDLGLMALGIFVAVAMAGSGGVEEILAKTQTTRFLGSFLAGLFFVSIFTVVPAGVVIVELTKSGALWEVALIGGLGALVGDLLIFRFVRDSLADDLFYLLKKVGIKRLSAILRLKAARWVMPFVGALIVASPLPDEIGLTMMGLVRLKTIYFIPISFALNSLGILVIGLVARI